MRFTWACTWTLLTVLGASVGVGTQRELPPISYVCPMSEHAQVLEDKPGQCPICKMVLVPVRIDQAYSCPTHAAVISEQPGICPLDKRQLVPVTVSLYWTCADKPDDHLTEPGGCANGTPRKAMREQRAHGDHNPRHGGQFFMAGDKWHHVEATYPRAGFLRVFVYDNFTKPIAVKEFSARAVTRETFDAATGKTRELEMAPLRASRDGHTFEARIAARTLPAKVTLKMKFDPRLPEERFDFSFETFSKEPPSAPAAPVSASATSREPSPPIPAPSPPQSAVASPPAEVGRFSEVLPATAPELLALLKARSAEVQDLIQRGQFGAVYVPALLAKDIALALEDHLGALPDQRRLQATTAIRRIVLAAWQLDASGDLGNSDKVSAAYARFGSAVTDLDATLSAGR